MEAIAGIRRKHFIEGKTIKEIARDLKVSRNTARNAEVGETSLEYERVVSYSPYRIQHFLRAIRRSRRRCESQ
ncbi:hypothetical protein [Rhodopseudomonas palustris]|uniref:hypothetical protein n=1 Tax=Rhodopseudomonas palustris TaxID=1076 RepID=UPI0021F2F90E|nr:hypothetical protein [Rhodopseudomonas palustris]